MRAPPRVAYGRPRPPATVAVMVSRRKLKPRSGPKVPIVAASAKPAKPATAPARAQVPMIIRRAGGGGDRRGGRDVLVEDPLRGVRDIGADGKKLAVGEVRDPADRVLERERDRRQRQDRRHGEPDADGHEESGHVVLRALG